MAFLDLGSQQKLLDPFQRNEDLNEGGNRVGDQPDGVLQSGEDHDGSEGDFGLHLIAEQDIGVEGGREDERAGEPVDEDG